MATAVGNVLLNISTGKTDFASIKGFTDLLGQAVRLIGDFAKKNDEYVDALQKMTIRVDSAVQATGSLIETQKLMQTTAKLSAAGVNMTEESFRNLAVAAADMGEITGDAGAELEKLTSAVISGNERGLKPYGISLEGCNTKAEKQAAIMEELGKKYGNVTVQADTLTDQVSALGNAFSDVVGSIWADINSQGAGIFGFFNKLTSTISKLAADIRELGTSNGLMATIARLTGDQAGLTYALAMGRREKGGSAADFDKKREYDAKMKAEREGREKATAAADRDWESGAWSGKGGGGGGGGTGGDDKKAEAMSQYEAQAAGLYGGKETFSTYPSSIESEIGLYTNETELALEKDPSAAIKEEGQLLIELDEIKQSLFEKEMVRAERRRAMIEGDREFQLSYSEEFRMNWNKAMTAMSAGAMAASAATQMLRGSVTMAANAIATSSKFSVRAFAEMIKGIALQTAIQASIQGIMEAATAISCYAREDYKGGAAHTGAAAVNFGVAVIAASVAAGATFIAKAAGGGHKDPKKEAMRGGTAVGASRRLDSTVGVPGGGGGAGGGSNVTVVLEGDAGGVFKVAQKGSRQAAANGDKSFGER